MLQRSVFTYEWQHPRIELLNEDVDKLASVQIRDGMDKAA